MASKTLLRLGAVVGLIGLTGGAWLAGRQVRSPAEAAAKARPPTASRITAGVEERTLESTVIVRGIVRYGDPRSVVLATSAAKTTTSGATLIVSTPAEKGATLPEGATALIVGGRPVFVLQGKLPAYRDMRPGDVGEDVSQLEAALARLGFSPGPVDGKYDSATQRAVDALYESKGFRSFGPTDSQRTQLRTSRSSVGQADDAVLNAQRNVDQMRRSSEGDKLLSAQEQVTSAESKVTAAQSDAVTSAARSDSEVQARQEAADLAARQVMLAQQTLDRSKRDAVDTTPVADSRDGLETARSSLRSAIAARDEAQTQIPLGEAAVKDATVTADQARKDLDTTKSTSSTSVAPNGVITVYDGAERVKQAESFLRQAEASLRQAEATLATANRSVDARAASVTDAERAVSRAEASVGRAGLTVKDRSSTVADAEQRLLSAQNDAARTQRELATSLTTRETTTRNSAEAIRQAKAAAKIAGSQLAAVRTPSDLASAQAQLRNAEASRARAQTELADLEAQVGIFVPANEVLFFPTLPLRVDEAKALRGDVVTGPVMTVTTARLAVDSSVNTSDAKLVRKGAKVKIESSEFDVEIDGTVTDIAATAGTKGVDPGKVYLEVTPTDDAVKATGGASVDPTDLNGSSVKLTIPIESTGKAVLAVPVAGVSVAADGSSRIEIEDSPVKPTRFVRVRTGISAEGFVAVIPIEGALKAGDLVVVGNRDGSLIAGAVQPNDQPGDGSTSTDVATTVAPPDTETATGS